MADMRVKTIGSGDAWEPHQGTQGAAEVRTDSIVLDTGGESQQLNYGTEASQSTAITTTSGRLLITVTADCFIRQGSDPTALADGTDIFLPVGMYRLSGFVSGNKVSIVTSSGTGSAFITPGA